MKRKILLVLVLAFVCTLVLASCTTKHTHKLEHVEAVPSTCVQAGAKEYWHCTDCNKYFADANAETEITLESTVLPLGGHVLTHKTITLPTCTKEGNQDCWYCTACNKYFAESSAINQIDESSVTIVATGHIVSEQYSSDKDYHWHECTNAKCTEKLDYTLHDFDDGVDVDENTSKFTCSVCNYEKNDKYATGKVTGKLTGTGVTDYSDFTLVISGKYTYTFVDAVNSDGTFAIDVRIGSDWTLLAYNGNGYASDVTDKFDVVADNNAEQNITVESGKVILSDVTVNGRLVKAYGNLNAAVVDDNGVFTADSNTISNIPSAGWGMGRVRYLLPIATQVKSGVFAFDTTLTSSNMYGYAGVGITDGNAIFYIETPSQTLYDEGGVRICFGTYTDTGWDFKFAMIMKCGGVDAQTQDNYQQRFSIRHYDDCFKLYAGDVCFATLTAENGLSAQDNYKMVNSPFFLKQNQSEAFASFMSANEYALLYGCDYGIAHTCSYVSEFNNEYVLVSGSVTLPQDASGYLADTRLVVSNDNKTYTYSNVIDEDGNYTIEIATGTYDFAFSNPAGLSVVSKDVQVAAGATTLDPVTLKVSNESSSSVTINGRDVKIGLDIDDTSSITLSETGKKTVLFGNTVYNGEAKYKATFNATNVTKVTNALNTLVSVGITDGASMMRVTMRANYTNKVEFEYLLINGEGNGYWVSNYRSYVFQADFLPTFDGATNGDVNVIFHKKADGTIDVYYEDHLLVTVTSKGFYVAEGITTPNHTLEENRRLPDAVAAWACPATPEAPFMLADREFAIWGCYEAAAVGGTIGFKASVESIHAEEQKDTKAAALNKVLKDKYFSILGDSISTWDSISNSGTNNNTISSSYNSCYPYYDVDKLEEVYWYQLMQNTGMNLLVNNSIGGSRAYGEATDTTAACNDRCVNLHANTGDLNGTNPDIIFVYIGINDVGHSTETVEQFTQGYRQIIQKITEKYTDSQVFVIDLPYPGSSPWLAQYNLEKFNKCNEAINSIATEFSLPIIHLRNSIADDAANLTCDQLHPNVAGMAAYYQVIRDALYDFYCAE